MTTKSKITESEILITIFSKIKWNKILLNKLSKKVSKLKLIFKQKIINKNSKLSNDTRKKQNIKYLKL